MLNWILKNKQKSAGPFDGWGPAPGIPWQPPVLPNPTRREIQPPVILPIGNRVAPATILSVGQGASEAVKDCLEQMIFDGQHDLSGLSAFSILPVELTGPPSGKILNYRNIPYDKPSSLFEYLNVIPIRNEVMVVLGIGNRADVRIVEDCLKQLKEYFQEVNLFLLTPQATNHPDVLAQIRELERFGWNLPHIFRINDAFVKPLKNTYSKANPGQVVDHILYTGTTTSGMAEVLYTWIHPSSRHSINEYLNNIYGAMGNILQIAREQGHPYLVNFTAASLYLPRAEYQAFLNSALIKKVLFGAENQKGLLNADDKKNRLEEFQNFTGSKHYHPLFNWLIVKLAEQQPQSYPTMSETDRNGFYSAFCRHFAAYVGKELQSGELTIDGLEVLLSGLKKKIKLARINTSQNQGELQTLLNEIDKFLDLSKEEVKNWMDSIFIQAQSVVRIVPVKLSEKTLHSLQDQIENRYESSIQVFNNLLRHQYSIPAVDGSLGSDPNLFMTIAQRIEDDKITDQFRWLVDLDGQKKINLRFCLSADKGWKQFRAEELINKEFQSVVDDIISSSVITLLSGSTVTTFLENARIKADKLKIAQSSSLPHKSQTSNKEAFVFAYNTVIGEEFSNHAFTDLACHIQKVPNYPLTRISALKIDSLIPLQSTDLYIASVGALIGKSTCYISSEERTAAKIESFIRIYSTDPYRMLSPELCASLTDQEPVMVFFRCLFAGSFVWKPIQDVMGRNGTHAWFLKEVGDWPEQMFSGDTAEKSLDALVKTYIEFVIKRHFFETKIEAVTSAYHPNKWKIYLQVLSRNALSVLTDKTTLRSSVDPLWRIFGFTEIQPENDLSNNIAPIIRHLMEQNRWLERDYVGLLFFYYEQIKNSLEG